MVQPQYLVSVAARQTLDTWRVAAIKLLEHLPANQCELIVPRADVPLFRNNTPGEFAVSSEDDYVTEFSGTLRDKLGELNPRFGWYLQQFIKLEAVRRHSDLSRLVIWDADTIPLVPLTLFSPEGEPVFYQGKEHHQPYFETITKLLGLEKVVDFSFVAQCFPLRGDWASAFFAELEGRHSVSWWQAIIDRIDPAEGSGFSEYETLGTFVNNRFAPLHFQAGQWTRRGYHHVSSPKKLLRSGAPQNVVNRFDFVAFEDWKRPKRKTTRIVKSLTKKIKPNLMS